MRNYSTAKRKDNDAYTVLTNKTTPQREYSYFKFQCRIWETTADKVALIQYNFNYIYIILTLWSSGYSMKNK